MIYEMSIGTKSRWNQRGIWKYYMSHIWKYHHFILFRNCGKPRELSVKIAGNPVKTGSTYVSNTSVLLHQYARSFLAINSTMLTYLCEILKFSLKNKYSPSHKMFTNSLKNITLARHKYNQNSVRVFNTQLRNFWSVWHAKSPSVC